MMLYVLGTVLAVIFGVVFRNYIYKFALFMCLSMHELASEYNSVYSDKETEDSE